MVLNVLRKAGEAPKQTVDFEEIYTEGISNITDIDFKYAKTMNKINKASWKMQE